MAARIRTVRSHTPALCQVEYLAQNGENPVRLVRGCVIGMVKLRHILTPDIGGLALAERRQDRLLQQSPIFLGRALLALGIDMLAQEALGEVGDAWCRTPCRAIGGGIESGSYQPEQSLCLGARRLHRPRGTMRANCQRAQKSPSATATRPIAKDVALATAGARADTEAF